jgi:hypothetical protein
VVQGSLEQSRSGRMAPSPHRSLDAVLVTQQMLRGYWQYSILLVIVACLLWPSIALHAQELEPRAYSAAPVSANFLPVAYSHSMGGVLVDPSLPVTDVEARIDVAALGYVRTFGLFGRSASLARCSHTSGSMQAAKSPRSNGVHDAHGRDFDTVAVAVQYLWFDP